MINYRNIVDSKDFVSYWDKTIKEWADSGGKVPPSEQMWFDFNPNLNKWKDLMPEPYWGDPDNCAIVVLNYNPGASNKICLNDTCHINRKEDRNSVCGLMLEKYSRMAKKFPLYEENPKEPFGLYGGTKWWKNRSRWIDRIVKDINPEIETKEIKPFALDVCAWHSYGWKSISYNKPIQQYLKDKLETVVREAIKASECKIGLCIGKDYGEILELMNFNNITPCFFDVNEDQSYQPLKDIKRYYRIYKSSDEIWILNSYAMGSNKAPSNKFRDKEKEIIKKIKDEK